MLVILALALTHTMVLDAVQPTREPRACSPISIDSLVAQCVQKNNLEDLSCRERSSIVDRQLLCDNELSQILFIFKFDPRTAKYQIPGIEVCIHRDTL